MHLGDGCGGQRCLVHPREHLLERTLQLGLDRLAGRRPRQRRRLHLQRREGIGERARQHVVTGGEDLPDLHEGDAGFVHRRDDGSRDVLHLTPSAMAPFLESMTGGDPQNLRVPPHPITPAECFSPGADGMEPPARGPEQLEHEDHHHDDRELPAQGEGDEEGGGRAVDREALSTQNVRGDERRAGERNRRQEDHDAGDDRPEPADPGPEHAARCPRGEHGEDDARDSHPDVVHHPILPPLRQ